MEKFERKEIMRSFSGKNKLFYILLLSTVLYGCSSDKTNSRSPDKTENTVNSATTEENFVEEILRTEPPVINESTVQTEEIKYSSISEIQLDDLQQLYLDFDSSLSYPDAIEYVTNTGLPYSEEKYNGSRQIQVAFTEGCTAQKYKEESGDHLTIIYVYPKDENSSNDELDKYLFGTCSYIPADSSLQLIEHNNGYYFSIYEPGNYISKLGTQLELDSSMTREEQMLYYFNKK